MAPGNQPHWPPPSLELGGYRLEAPLGVGGMGAVYRARAADDASVAIKVLPGRLITDEALARFDRETEVRVEHPNVVRVLDAGRAEDGSPYLVMELLHGESLEARIARGPMKPNELVDLGIQICHGLEAVHAAGIVHRDLKPANVFCTADGAIKLLDFGIARVSSRETRLTEQGVILGTPLYLAPEQARGANPVDARTDLWSLGVIAYEALAGESPFARDTVVETLVAVLLDDVPRLSARVSGLSPELYAIVDRLLSRKPDLRFQSAAELRAAFEALGASDDGADTGTERLSIPGGEDRVVAVLFAMDVLDSDALAAEVEAMGGRFSSLLGGRAIAVFGGERWDGDEHARAARVALANRHVVGQIAVAAGRARTTGGSVTGDAVQRAERSCRAGVQGVAVDPVTAELLPDFEVRPAGELLELVGEAGRPETRLAGPPTVGRRRELSQMRDAISAVEEEERPWCVLVTGPPGCGKTRLAGEMRALTREMEGARVFEGTGQPLTRDDAWSLFASLLGAGDRRARASGAWGVRLDPLIAERRARLETMLEVIDDPDVQRESALFLGELLGLPSPETPPMLDEARRNPSLMAERIRLALSELFGAFIARDPVAFLLEDLHWADGASLALLEQLCTRYPDRPLLVFGTARPQLLEDRPNLFVALDSTRLRLRGLSTKLVGKLAEHVAGRGLAPEAIEAIASRTAGNPLFVTQVVAQLRDNARLDDPASELPLPLTVEASVQARLDQLDDEERRLCRCAAIWERPFSPLELEALGVDKAAVSLGRLVRRDLLASGKGRDAGRYAFRSTLTREVAYRAIEADGKVRLHLDAARFLSGTGRADAEEVATHFERANERATAGRWFVTAAREAAARGDAEGVIRCGERALALGAPEEVRFDLLLLLADAFRFVGRREDQGDALERALRLAESVGARARVLVERVSWLTARGRLDEAVSTGREAVDVARQSEEAELVVLALVRFSSALFFAGDHDAAAQVLDEAREIEAPVSGSTLAFLEAQRGRLASMRGDLGRARESFGRAAAQFRDVGDLRRAAANEQNLADSHNRVGAYDEAIDALQGALALADRAGNRVIRSYALTNLGHAQLGAGRAEEALATLDQAEAQVTTNNEARLMPVVAVYRARALLAAGKLDEAAAEAQRGGDLAEDTGQRPIAVLATSVRARVALERGDAEEALRLAQEAMVVRDEIGGVEEGEAELFLALAKALEAAGDAEQAAAVRAQGRAHLEDRAAKIEDAALRERFLAQAAHLALLG